jgi:hypothetical protein
VWPRLARRWRSRSRWSAWIWASTAPRRLLATMLMTTNILAVDEKLISASVDTDQ